MRGNITSIEVIKEVSNNGIYLVDFKGEQEFLNALDNKTPGRLRE